MGMRRSTLLLGFGALAFAGAACQVLVGVSEQHGDGPPPKVAPFDICVHAEPPTPPEGGTDTTELDTMTFAATSFRVHPVGAGPVGYDLDGLCTGLDGSVTNLPSCVKMQRSTDVDGPGGIDNSFAAFADTLNFKGDFAASSLNGGSDRGDFTILVQLGKYNGQADDDLVTVAIISASHLECPPDAGAPTDGGLVGLPGQCSFANPPLPKHDGTDTWTYLGMPVLVDGKATDSVVGYVKDHVLVIEPPGTTLEVTLIGPTLTFSRPILTGTLTPVGTGFRLENAVLAGTVPSDQAIGFIEHAPIPDTDGGLICNNPLVNLGAKLDVCNTEDIRGDLDASGPCNAMSFGLGFDGEPALIGGPAPSGLIDACGAFDASCGP